VVLASGTRFGPYQISAPLGAGGMDKVYRATDTNLARQVAIRVLPHVVAADADRLARFDREAKTLAVLNHPNIAANRSNGYWPNYDVTPDGKRLMMIRGTTQEAATRVNVVLDWLGST
jgi:serine/threonine protein kinase